MRLHHVLNILQQHLDDYISDATVKVGNVSSRVQADDNSVMLTLVKIEEEHALKNGRYTKLNQQYKTVYKNRPVFTNLYILFASNFTTYTTALARLSQTVEFFQGTNTFTNLQGYTGGNDSGEKFKLIVELETLSLEQINYMWSFLGGKQLPSALYKVRMIPLEVEGKIDQTGSTILKVNVDESMAL